MDNPRILWSDQDQLTPQLAAIFLGGSKPLALSTLSNWRRAGIGPAYIRVGKSIRYPVSMLKEFLSAGTVHVDDIGGKND
ncbi:hypothetical protein MCEKH45_00707 [Methylophilaceae bacterium]